MGPVVIALVAGVVVLGSGLLVNGCRISRLLSPTSTSGMGTGGGSGGGVITVVPSLVKDSALAGTGSPRVSNLAVTNNGAWIATPGEGWIDVIPSSGVSRATVQLALDPKDLPPGLHRGTVTVRQRDTGGTEGASATVSVSFLIQQPILKVEPSDFNYKARTSSSVFRDTIYITNEGTGPLVWSVTTEKRSHWVQFESDTTGTAPSTLALKVTNAGLSFFGTHKETIIIHSPGAKNSPRRIEVTMRRKFGGDDDDDDDSSVP